jgi:hypothetical protein
MPPSSHAGKGKEVSATIWRRIAAQAPISDYKISFLAGFSQLRVFRQSAKVEKAFHRL